MTRELSLSYVTLSGLQPPDFVSTAARAGFRSVGVRLATSLPGETVHPLIGAPAALRETVERLAAEGVSVLDLEALRLERGMSFDAAERFFETGQRLGARQVLTVSAETDDGATAALLREACERAAPYGLTIDLEFLPYGSVTTLAQAARIVGAADHDGARVVVDALHFHRSGGGIGDLAAVPRAIVSCAHLCDAPLRPPADRAGLMHEARHERLAPGEGALDLRAFLAALPPGLPVAVEIMNDDWRRDLSPDDRALRAFRGAASVLARTDA